VPNQNKSGISATGNPVTHVYQQNGEFKVGLTICSSQFDSTIWVIDKPSVSIFPNPFAVQTNIQYLIPNPAHIKIAVTDMLGRYITTLVDNNLGTGGYNTIFDAATLKTRSGLYLVVFMMDDKVIVKKIVQWDSIFY